MTNQAPNNGVATVVVTAGPKAPPDGAMVRTPIGTHDVQVKLMSRTQQIAIRTVRTYIQSFVGFLLATGTGAVGAVTDAVGVEVTIPARDFLDLCVVAASLSVAPAVIALLQNTAELLTELERTNPELRA